MTKKKIRHLTDLLPFIILVVSAIVLLWVVITTDIVFMWQHIVGLCFLPVIFLAFRWYHKMGVLVTGLTLLIGLTGLLSYNPAVTTLTLTIGKNTDSLIPFFHGQPIFIVWLLIHFIVSARHYRGIATKKYWSDLLNRSTEYDED